MCPNYSLHQELQFDGCTSRFRIDCNLTTFGASSAQMSGRITNLIASNDFLGPNYPRKLPFPEKYCIFRKWTLSSRILVITDIYNSFKNFRKLISQDLHIIINDDQRKN